MARRIAHVDGIMVRVDPDWGPDTKEAIWQGTYEQDERSVLALVIRPDDKVLDIGSGIGVVALSVARRLAVRAVRCVEANPKLKDAFQQHCSINHIPIALDQVWLTPDAVLDQAPKDVKFHAAAEFLASAATSDGDVDVPRASLEKALRAHRASVLSLDIEGAEYELLTRGDLSGLRAVVMETHPQYLTAEQGKEIISALYAAGMQLSLSHIRGQVYGLIRDIPGTLSEADALRCVDIVFAADALAHEGVYAAAIERLGELPKELHAPAIAVRRALWSNFNKDNEASFEAASEAVIADPAYTEGWRLLGIASLKLKRFDQAERAFTRALCLAPTMSGLHFGLAQATLALKKPTVAMMSLRQSTLLHPEQPNADTLMQRARDKVRAQPDDGAG